MRALAFDTVALQAPIDAVHPDWLQPWSTNPAYRRYRNLTSAQARRWPTVLVTTPESLSVILVPMRVRRCRRCAWWWWMNGMSCWQQTVCKPSWRLIENSKPNAAPGACPYPG
jgi:hypothetical protein